MRRRASGFLIAVVFTAAAVAGVVHARRARDAQDRAALEAEAAQAAAGAAQVPQNAHAQYESALVYSYLAEVAAELRELPASRQAAEAGIAAAERAVALKPDSAEFHRLLGALYGQAIAANLAAALKYGRKSLEALDRAAALDPKSSDVYLSRGVGKYYLPAALGGGPDAALEELRRAIELNPKSDQAYLWMGLALRKANRHAEARQALERAVALNPQRVWARQQLEKTPGR